MAASTVLTKRLIILAINLGPDSALEGWAETVRILKNQVLPALEGKPLGVPKDTWGIPISIYNDISALIKGFTGKELIDLGTSQLPYGIAEKALHIVKVVIGAIEEALGGRASAYEK